MKTTEPETSGRPASAPGLRERALAGKIDAGALVAQRELVTISGQVVSVPDSQRYVHLQFRRFAGCPVCNLHLRSFVKRHREIVNAGIHEVVLFHSSTEELTAHASDLPFAVIADPHKRLYAEFGVEASVRSLLHPRAWFPIARGLWRSLWEIIVVRRPVPSLNPAGGRFGLPADFLIANSGVVVAAKYGVHAYDQWSVDQLLGFVGIADRTFPPLKISD